MATLLIQKISGVLQLTSGSTSNPKCFFSATGSYQVADDNVHITILISQAGETVPNTYYISYTELTVGTSHPSNIGSAKVLLNAIFGT